MLPGNHDQCDHAGLAHSLSPLAAARPERLFVFDRPAVRPSAQIGVSALDCARSGCVSCPVSSSCVRPAPPSVRCASAGWGAVSDGRFISGDEKGLPRDQSEPAPPVCCWLVIGPAGVARRAVASVQARSSGADPLAHLTARISSWAPPATAERSSLTSVLADATGA